MVMAVHPPAVPLNGSAYEIPRPTSAFEKRRNGQKLRETIALLKADKTSIFSREEGDDLRSMRVSFFLSSKAKAAVATTIAKLASLSVLSSLSLPVYFKYLFFPRVG